jgi:hypothetical protein
MSGFQIVEGDVVLRDAAGNPVVVQRDGNYYQLAVHDQGAHEILTQILVELRKLNVHMTMINGDAVKDHDVEG